MAAPVSDIDVRKTATGISVAINTHLASIKNGKGYSSTLYELYVGLEYLAILKSRGFSIAAINAQPQNIVVLPKAPAAGNIKFSHFTISEVVLGQSTIIARVYYGLEILATDKMTHRAPDITVAEPSSNIANLTSKDVWLLIDAKCRTAKNKDISLHEIDNFVRVNEKLDAPKTNNFNLSWTGTSMVSCLVTNGKKSGESDTDLTLKNILEVTNFRPGSPGTIRP